MARVPVSSYNIFEVRKDVNNNEYVVPIVNAMKQTKYNYRYDHKTIIECQPHEYCTIYPLHVKVIRGKYGRIYKNRNGLTQGQTSICRYKSINKLVGGYTYGATNLKYAILDGTLIIKNTHTGEYNKFEIREQ